MKSGVVMGLSEALKEEVTFDKSRVTSTNWDRYMFRIRTSAKSTRNAFRIRRSKKAELKVLHNRHLQK
jgi:hypothetical protein